MYVVPLGAALGENIIVTQREPAPSRGSGAWYRWLTDDELRSQIDGNMPGGSAHDNAMAELERRQSGRDRDAEMRWIKRTFWASVVLGLAGILATALVGCSSNDELYRAAVAFNLQAERCLLSVRDQRLEYDASPPCRQLGTASRAYIQAGGQLKGETVDTRLIAEQGLRMAWNARAISAGAPSSLW